MGTWATAPWNNDSGADWFGDMFDNTKLADYVRRTLKEAEPQNDYAEIRAAASMVVMLGRVYVWPIKQLDEDLSLAAEKLEVLLKVPELNESAEIIASIQEEIRELRSRMKQNKPQPPQENDGRKWWQFWK